MRPGKLTRVPVEDVTFAVNFTWGDFKRLQKRVSGLSEDEKGLDGFDAILAEEVLPRIVSVEGLEDADGNPVAQVTMQVMDDYPAELIGGLLGGLMDIGSRLGGQSSPPA